MIDRDAVVACYRYILGREPENEEVVQSQIDPDGDLAQLRAQFFASPEFAQIMTTVMQLQAPLPLNLNRIKVDTQANASSINEILARTTKYWSQIGEDAAYWSVITSKSYGPDRIKENMNQFFLTGRYDLDLILSAIRRHRSGTREISDVVEYGCGVGRVTMHLSKKFASIVSIDCSSSHLRIAGQHLQEARIENVKLMLSNVENLHVLTPCDLWFSRLVLQHNPPPIIKEVLTCAFRSLRPSGLAIFQVPTYQQNYTFKIKNYLTNQDGLDMEMHVFPQEHIFQLAKEENCAVLEVREDISSISKERHESISNFFVLRKNSGAGA